jgi:hypothetical protein
LLAKIIIVQELKRTGNFDRGIGNVFSVQEPKINIIYFNLADRSGFIGINAGKFLQLLLKNKFEFKFVVCVVCTGIFGESVSFLRGPSKAH